MRLSLVVRAAGVWLTVPSPKGKNPMPFPTGLPRPLPRPQFRYTFRARCMQWAILYDHSDDKAPCADAAAYQKLLDRNITKFMNAYMKYGHEVKPDRMVFAPQRSHATPGA